MHGEGQAQEAIEAVAPALNVQEMPGFAHGE
jgi:hypothetical protein